MQQIYRERKLHDMTLRLDSLYDVIVELEEKIEDARLRRDAIKQQAITLENIYKIMVNFDCVYNIINDEEKRNVVTALIKEIEIYRNDESEFSGVQGWRGSYGAFVGQTVSCPQEKEDAIMDAFRHFNMI